VFLFRVPSVLCFFLVTPRERCLPATSPPQFFSDLSSRKNSFPFLGSPLLSRLYHSLIDRYFTPPAQEDGCVFPDVSTPTQAEWFPPKASFFLSFFQGPAPPPLGRACRRSANFGECAADIAQLEFPPMNSFPLFLSVDIFHPSCPSISRNLETVRPFGLLQFEEWCRAILHTPFCPPFFS